MKLRTFEEISASLVRFVYVCSLRIKGPGVLLCFRNYGPTLLAQAEAKKKNCEQVLWLYGDDQQVLSIITRETVSQLLYTLSTFFL